MTRHLTHRFWICMVFGLGGFALALMARSLEPAAFGAPFVFALALSIADGWWPPAEVTNPEVSSPRVVEGDTLQFTFGVVTRQRSFVDVEVQLPSSLAPQSTTRFVTMIDRERRFHVDLVAARWGAAGPEWIHLVTRDRLGLTESVRRVPMRLPVRVHPPSENLSSLIPLYRERAVSGEHRARAKGSGTELAEVRPYRYGDPLRMVHPGLSARRNTPMVVERHPERSSEIVLMVDSAQDLGVDLETTLRWTVTAAMALGERHLRAQDRVGLLDVGRGIRWLPARLGRRHLHRIVDSLLATEVLPRNERHLARSLPNDLPRSATIVALSMLLSEDTLTTLVDLRSRGHEILVLQPPQPDPNPSTSMLARRIFRVGNELNHRWLRDRGVTIVPWQAGEPLEHVLRRVIRNLGRARQATR